MPKNACMHAKEVSEWIYTGGSNTCTQTNKQTKQTHSSNVFSHGTCKHVLIIVWSIIIVYKTFVACSLCLKWL